MLDLKTLRLNPEPVRDSLARRQADPAVIDRLLSLDEEHRSCQTRVDQLRQERNQASKEIGTLKKQGQDASSQMEAVRVIGEETKSVEERMQVCEDERKELLLNIPNTLDSSVPTGKDENENLEIRRWGVPAEFDFEPKAHDELGVNLGIMDFERAAKLTGSRFVVMKGWGSRLERTLISFMLDHNTQKRGYTEILPPFMVNRETMTANGNLPKFEDDLFGLNFKDFFLIPTAEVPLTNLHRTEILEKEDLPKYYTAYTPCFRAEAGAAGRDTRGIIRQHQFSKVELVKIVEPENSFDELEKMVSDAESLLQALELPYRVVLLCSGDTGFNAAKTYDIEVWFPSQGKYREISSCSNCTDFQARRGQLRYRPEVGASTAFPHTLNGSGLPIGRTLAALIENYQQSDGTIRIPKALQPYVGGESLIV
ncbi:serine--tRNA ligase [bacterium (Candidatus Blackallbacteria) CG17_big_fil_post_rev_8_21_14_2_50_48_46]|uniref:Serine--tRNA ligase n=1 Tax=bacterium (Candidatus Blackallbacteria) CG17_big_fil_post_rev_8_21_14_2_50_48_46 TaxID=2014261 RepID=A0A2M7G3I4_9BACT|nr:MAG: serine--tRNA ligase [bacterium (Candidatus Blackallbacteria) CG18_big_fil_WC_8_21_14_2_50_49_26]PIW16440.1 MAG: serine--tRNA ligase [bacterium (Candidatus Blackallbacteria) CG17_big_fil_post_rev_8_21_14_2_50_48_46]PIW45948.1 MAG: serine--tRNA ligase [bacterium (Candidatus Blackallbacteria) CG13_big_fil_rev_8_21_14_2_50_49_14]